MLLRLPALILNGNRSESTLPAKQRHAMDIPPKLHNIAAAAHAKRTGKDMQAARNNQISPRLPDCIVMGKVVQVLSFYGSEIILPLLLNMNQRPLPPAEGKMLEARQH